LEKIFICRVNSISNLYALLVWQNFIMQKVGITNLPPSPKRNLALEIRKRWEIALGNLFGVLLHVPR
jgi:hypothetical protein